MAPRLGKVLAVARYELGREASKRSLYVVVVLMVLPLLAALLVKRLAGAPAGVEEAERLWAVIMGVDPRGALASAGLAGVSSLSLFSWAWLIAILYGGDLLASDLQSGMASLILSRPVTRGEYVAGKILSVTAALVVAFLAGGVSVYAASWALAGPQEGLLEALGLSIVVALGSLPLLLLSALFGAYFEKPSLGMILGFVAYFVGAIASGLAAVYFLFTGDLERAATAPYIIQPLIPSLAGQELALAIYSRVHGLELSIPLTLPSDGGVNVVYYNVRPGDFLPHLAAGTLAWIVVLSLLTYLVIRRRDL